MKCLKTAQCSLDNPLVSELASFPFGHQRAAPWYENRTVWICPSQGLHLACSFSSFLIVLSCSDSYYGTVKICAAESMLYLICYAVQRSKRNSSMTDPHQILKTLNKLLTWPGTIYSQRNTKQDPVCLWHIVKIRSSRFPRLRKALMGSGNCSCNVRQC